MDWVAISGSWRHTNAQVETDVRQAVSEIIANGDGIVTGGALGVDYIATDEALKNNPDASRIKIILPTSLEVFEKHFFKRAQEGVISTEQATILLAQLKGVQQANAAAVREMAFEVCTPETYYARNQEVINAATKLYAFQVNDSQGTQDAIDKAISQEKPVTHKTYRI